MTTELNPEQQIAAEHREGPMLVLAGAGSGKTRVVTLRIARLIDQGVFPEEILSVTFTNKAAEEVKTRIRTMKNAKVLASTFHSLGARILRESIIYLGYTPDFTIYDEEDSQKLLKSCLTDCRRFSDKGAIKNIRNQISSAKNSLFSPEQITDQELKGVYERYQSKLKECNALDFDDLLYLTVKLLQEHEEARNLYQTRWRYLLIDEYQDTNLAQYTLARILVSRHGNLFAVGDPDQSIYSWRGAQYQNILNFATDFPGAKIVTLDQNYRSTNNILSAANSLIRNNHERYEKKLWSQLGEGAKIGRIIVQNERKEAEFVSERIRKHIQEPSLTYDDTAIFYRTNAQSRPFEDALVARKIPYKIIGGLSFYDRKEVKDILAFLRMTVSDCDLISFLRTLPIPRRGLGPSIIEKITQSAESEKKSIFRFCEEILENSSLKLSAKQREGLVDYVRIIRSLRAKKNSLKLSDFIAQTILETRYVSYLQEDAETFQDRKENIDELVGKATEWEEEKKNPDLVAFLEELSLRSSLEENANLPSVKLMTLHNSKGLEFPLVFLAGLEEGLLPHINAKDDEKAQEEERRLCYVGMTRAKRFLYLSAALSRFTWGSSRSMRPSRFLREIPGRYIQDLSPGASFWIEESQWPEENYD